MIVVSVSTETGGLRSEIYGWSVEDTDLYVPGQMIGFTPSDHRTPRYGTVFEYLANGFRLLGPPQRLGPKEWDWWLVNESRDYVTRGSEDR